MALCRVGRQFDKTHPVCLSCQRQGGGGCPESIKQCGGDHLVDTNEMVHEKPSSCRQPNKTEAEYGRMLSLEFPVSDVIYEGISLRLKNGHKFTPDWVVVRPSGTVLLVEVKARGKNGYRLPSYQRAKLAFDQAVIEWESFRFRWAEKHNGTWNAKEVQR